MKVIFLDIDGVLNWAGTEDRISGFIGLCPERIQRFNRIIDAYPDAKIVISSTWRKSGMFGVYEDFEGLIKLLKERGLKGMIIGRTPIRFSHVARGSEIRDFLSGFAEDFPDETIENVVVLDDSTEGMEGYTIQPSKWEPPGTEPRVFEDLRPKHVLTTWDGEQRLDKSEIKTDVEGGLQDKHIDLAIAVLSGQSICTGCLERLTDLPGHSNCLSCNGGLP